MLAIEKYCVLDDYKFVDLFLFFCVAGGLRSHFFFIFVHLIYSQWPSRGLFILKSHSLHIVTSRVHETKVPQSNSFFSFF